MAYWDGDRWVRESDGRSPDGRADRPSVRDHRQRSIHLPTLIATMLMCIGLSVLVIPFGAASARQPALSLTPASGETGGTIGVAGHDFSPKSRLQLMWDGAIKGMPTAQVNVAGVFQASIKVPSGAAGDHTVGVLELMAKGDRRSAAFGVAVLASVAFTVTGATSSPTNAGKPTLAPDESPTLKPTIVANPSVVPADTPDPTPTDPPAAAPTPVATPAATPIPTPIATPIPTTAPAPTSPPVPAGFVTACGMSLCLGGGAWYLYGASFVGGLEDPHGTVSRARAAGLNTLRITNWLHEEAGSDPYDPDRWVLVDRVLAGARAGGVKVVLDLSTYRNLLFNEGVNPYTQDWSRMVAFVTSRRNSVNGLRYADDPTIALVGFAGEVDGISGNADPRTPTTAELTDFYRRTFAEWRSRDANHLLEPGGLLQYGWNSGIDWRSIFALGGNDVCSIHDYSATDAGATSIVATYCRSIGKPWITEEFGWEQRTGDATRAARFQSMFDLQHANHAAGVAFWNLGQQTTGSTYDVNTTTDLTYATVQHNQP